MADLLSGGTATTPAFGAGFVSSGANEAVRGVFSNSEWYVQNAQYSLNLFTTKLNESIYTAPTISVTWNSIAPPALTLPEVVPSMPAIVVNMPTDKPAALDLGLDLTPIDTFTDIAPTLNYGTAPTLSYGAVPTIPTIGAVALPTADTVVLPGTPTYLALSNVSFAGIDMHDDWLTQLDSIPTLTILEPTPFSFAQNPKYTSALLTTLQARMSERMVGGTGLTPAVEQAIWDRARSRETSLALANEAEIMRHSEALGFSLPPGTLAAQLREAQQATYDKLSTLSRDVGIKQAEMEQMNLKDTFANVMGLESKLIDHGFQMEQLAFETSKEYANNAIQVNNARIEAFKAVLSGYQTYAAAYDTLIKGELAKVEVYKGQLQAEVTKATVNTAMVEQYKATISAEMSKVEIYKAQVGAAQTLVQLEQAKIGAAAEQVKGFVAQVNAETAKVEAYKAVVQAEGLKVDVYKSQTQAYAAKVSGQSEYAKAELGRYQALVAAKGQEWDAFKTRVQAETERVRALGLQSSTLLDGYKASNAAIESKANAMTRVWETEIKQYESATNIAMQTAKINNDSLVTANQAKLEAAKTGSQVYAQLVASAYGMQHASASITDASSSSLNDSKSYSESVSV